ncbi:hypothetical protein TNCV_4007781 [Trichonephila clavipes]|nr:hypothetical protein TNCV_4007781 [Trichonephila clavipes]
MLKAWVVVSTLSRSHRTESKYKRFTINYALYVVDSKNEKKRSEKVLHPCGWRIPIAAGHFDALPRGRHMSSDDANRNEDGSSCRVVVPARDARVIFANRATAVVQTSVRTSVSSHVKLMSGGSTHIVHYPTVDVDQSPSTVHLRKVLRYYHYKLLLLQQLLLDDLESQHTFALRFLAEVELQDECSWSIL